MNKIIISLVNFNSALSTAECLTSLKKITTDGIKLDVVIIDNASSERLELKVKEYKSLNLKIIKNSQNLGFSGGHNITIKHAIEQNADYVLILNNDTKVDKNFLKVMLKTFSRDNNICVVVPKIYFYEGYEFHKDRYKKSERGRVLWYAGGYMDWQNIIGKNIGVDEIDNNQYDAANETELATGCCMLVKVDAIRKIGYFDEKYFLYYEDADFSIRARQEGYKIYYQPEAFIWHKNAGSTGGSGSDLQDYYITRNRLIFGLKFGTYRTKFALLKESYKLLKRGRQWQKKGVIDYYLRKFNKGSFKTLQYDKF